MSPVVQRLGYSIAVGYSVTLPSLLSAPTSIFFPHVIASPTLTTLSRASHLVSSEVSSPEPTNEQNKWDFASPRQSVSATVTNTLLLRPLHFYQSSK